MSTYEEVTEYQKEGGKKDYQLMTSAHGSSYRFGGSDKNKPTLPNVTLTEAYMEGRYFVGCESTIGGCAQIYKVSTSEKFSLVQTKEILDESIKKYGLYAIALPLLERCRHLESILREIEVTTQKR